MAGWGERGLALGCVMCDTPEQQKEGRKEGRKKEGNPTPVKPSPVIVQKVHLQPAHFVGVVPVVALIGRFADDAGGLGDVFRVEDAVHVFFWWQLV